MGPHSSPSLPYFIHTPCSSPIISTSRLFSCLQSLTGHCPFMAATAPRPCTPSSPLLLPHRPLCCLVLCHRVSITFREQRYSVLELPSRTSPAPLSPPARPAPGPDPGSAPQGCPPCHSLSPTVKVIWQIGPGFLPGGRPATAESQDGDRDIAHGWQQASGGQRDVLPFAAVAC